MKTLKILTVAFIASLFMMACEDNAVEPVTGIPLSAQPTAADQIDSYPFPGSN